MTWIAPKLNQRVQILKPTASANDNGSLDLTFGTPFGDAFETDAFDRLAALKTVWMGVKPIGFKGTGARYVRGEQISELATHIFKVRHLAVNFGKAFSDGFNDGFKTMDDLITMKSNYFLFFQKGLRIKGRLFRIHEVVNDGEHDEFLMIVAEEIESRGVGYGT
jgi:hypothetical protein